MEIEKILTLIDKVSASGLTEFRLEEGNLQLCMKKEKKAEAASEKSVTEKPDTFKENSYAIKSTLFSETEEETENIDTSEAKNIVCSPLVGTFYLAPSPEEEPFVKTGDAVKKGQTLGIIEAMKLMNEIVAEQDGVVEKVLVQNGEMVEYGQPLFRIR